MANTPRVIIGYKGGAGSGVSGFFFSKPGFDVRSANEFQLILDSRLGSYASVHQTGTIAAGQTISFPSLPYRPLTICCVTTGGQDLGIRWFGRNASPPSGYDTSVQQVRNPNYRVTNSTLTVFNPTWYGDSGAWNFTARYVILKCPGG